MTIAIVAGLAVFVAVSAAALTTVNKAQNVVLGGILVTPAGWTLYGDAAEHGNAVRCVGACATVWRPLLISSSAKPIAGPGVSSKLLGTIKRPGDGKLQVTYNGHPLYTYSGDKRAGQVNGQGLDGTWHVLTPAGAIVLKSAAPSSGSISGKGNSGSTSSSSSPNPSTSNASTGATTTGGGTSTIPNQCNGDCMDG